MADNTDSICCRKSTHELLFLSCRILLLMNRMCMLVS